MLAGITLGCDARPERQLADTLCGAPPGSASLKGLDLEPELAGHHPDAPSSASAIALA